MLPIHDTRSFGLFKTGFINCWLCRRMVGIISDNFHQTIKVKVHLRFLIYKYQSYYKAVSAWVFHIVFSVSNNTCRQAPQGGIGVSRKSFSVRAAMASVFTA